MKLKKVKGIGKCHVHYCNKKGEYSFISRKGKLRERYCLKDSDLMLKQKLYPRCERVALSRSGIYPDPLDKIFVDD